MISVRTVVPLAVTPKNRSIIACSAPVDLCRDRRGLAWLLKSSSENLKHISSELLRRCQPLTPTLSPLVGRGRDPRGAWEGGGPARPEFAYALLLPLLLPSCSASTFFGTSS